MRVAFDLDDTLIPTTVEFAGGSTTLPMPMRLFFREPLRNGARELLADISRTHELWLYTTSLRHPIYLKLWFKFLGIPLAGAINQDSHQRTIRNASQHSGYSKVPQLFNIDLLVDDSPGVAIECELQGCAALIVDPSDLKWSDRVRSKLELDQRE